MCVIYTFVLSVVLGVLFGDHSVTSWSWSLHAVSQTVPREITAWGLGDPAGKEWVRTTVLSSEGETAATYFISSSSSGSAAGRGFGTAAQSLWVPCSCADPTGLDCSVQLPSTQPHCAVASSLINAVSDQILSIWVFRVWTVLVALLSTLNEAFRPQGGCVLAFYS